MSFPRHPVPQLASALAGGGQAAVRCHHFAIAYDLDFADALAGRSPYQANIAGAGILPVAGSRQEWPTIRRIQISLDGG